MWQPAIHCGLHEIWGKERERDYPDAKDLGRRFGAFHVSGVALACAFRVSACLSPALRNPFLVRRTEIGSRASETGSKR